MSKKTQEVRNRKVKQEEEDKCLITDTYDLAAQESITGASAQPQLSGHCMLSYF